jgi:hypothetical protein
MYLNAQLMDFEENEPASTLLFILQRNHYWFARTHGR